MIAITFSTVSSNEHSRFTMRYLKSVVQRSSPRAVSMRRSSCADPPSCAGTAARQLLLDSAVRKIVTAWGTRPDRRRALHVDAHHHILAAQQRRAPRLQDPLVLAVHQRAPADRRARSGPGTSPPRQSDNPPRRSRWAAARRRRHHEMARIAPLLHPLDRRILAHPDGPDSTTSSGRGRASAAYHSADSCSGSAEASRSTSLIAHPTSP